jgi:hypothetical protein
MKPPPRAGKRHNKKKLEKGKNHHGEKKSREEKGKILSP